MDTPQQMITNYQTSFAGYGYLLFTSDCKHPVWIVKAGFSESVVFQRDFTAFSGVIYLVLKGQLSGHGSACIMLIPKNIYQRDIWVGHRFWKFHFASDRNVIHLSNFFMFVSDLFTDFKSWWLLYEMRENNNIMTQQLSIFYKF